ncbi:hypothetical protein OJ996_19770 [Luteolibacter sp. GHJ8]|uniref:Uncharacterized protein n=1 Tax=Luteolibacter rhizosphaerae TaxID=2989719 RepID=A0ABT3G7M2_9BACT|nr:hypothetical protein [Luteolibacter rhizosphaerae]
MRITSGVNEGKRGVVLDQVISGGTLLYLVKRENGSSWVEEDQMAVLDVSDSSLIKGRA